MHVRVRRSTARRQRTHRAMHLVFGVVLWLSLAAGACFGFHAIVEKFFLHNPDYSLHHIDTDLDDLMTADQAVQISGLHLGENIFRLDLARAERALKQIDQVDNVTIQRDWPDRVSIKIVKRVPVAWLAKAGTTGLSADDDLLLDSQGRTMHAFRVEPDYWRLPIIYAPDPSLIVQGDTLAVSDLKSALDLLASLRGRIDIPIDVRSVDITKGYAIEVCDAAKVVYTFSPDDPADQLDRLQHLLATCRTTGQELVSVDLIPKKYTPVRFLLASAEESPRSPGKNHSEAAR